MNHLDTTLDVLTREWGDVVRLLGDVTTDGWRRPTRLAGWTVADLGAHLVWGVSMEAEAVRRARRGVEMLADGRHLPTDDAPMVPDALASAVAELLEALHALRAADDLDRERVLVPLATGAFPLPFVQAVLAMEAGIHADDVRAALGQPRPLPDDVVRATLDVLRAYLPVMGAAGAPGPADGTRVVVVGGSFSLGLQHASDGWAVDDGTGPATTTVAADDSDAVRFLMGRIPADAPTLTITGEREPAAAFKRWFPGP